MLQATYELDSEAQQDIIGDIVKDLRANKCALSQAAIDHECTTRLIMNGFSELLCKTKNIDPTYPQNRRFNIIIDRREFKNDLIIFEPPNDCNKLNGHLPETYFDLSKQSLIPRKGDESQTHKLINTKNASKGQILRISYHVCAADEVKTYLFWNGQCHRFCPQDILELLPHIFIKNDANKNFVQSNYAKKLIMDSLNRIKDSKFEMFYRGINQLNKYEFPMKYSKRDRFDEDYCLPPPKHIPSQRNNRFISLQHSIKNNIDVNPTEESKQPNYKQSISASLSIGGRLYYAIHPTQPKLAGKITAMLLHSVSIKELHHLLSNSTSLQRKINEAMAVLKNYQSNLYRQYKCNSDDIKHQFTCNKNKNKNSMSVQHEPSFTSPAGCEHDSSIEEIILEIMESSSFDENDSSTSPVHNMQTDFNAKDCNDNELDQDIKMEIQQICQQLNAQSIFNDPNSTIVRYNTPPPPNTTSNTQRNNGNYNRQNQDQRSGQQNNTNEYNNNSNDSGSHTSGGSSGNGGNDRDGNDDKKKDNDGRSNNDDDNEQDDDKKDDENKDEEEDDEEKTSRYDLSKSILRVTAQKFVMSPKGSMSMSSLETINEDEDEEETEDVDLIIKLLKKLETKGKNIPELLFKLLDQFDDEPLDEKNDEKEFNINNQNSALLHDEMYQTQAGYCKTVLNNNNNVYVSPHANGMTNLPHNMISHLISSNKRKKKRKKLNKNQRKKLKLQPIYRRINNQPYFDKIKTAQKMYISDKLIRDIQKKTSMSLSKNNIRNYMNALFEIYYEGKSEYELQMIDCGFVNEETKQCLYCSVKGKNKNLKSYPLNNALQLSDEVIPKVEPIKGECIDKIIHIINAQNTLQNTVKYCAWDEVPIIHRKDDQFRITASVTKERLFFHTKEFIANRRNVISIVSYSKKQIDFICIIKIRTSVYIALSLEYITENNNMKINAVCLDKEDLLIRHYLADPSHMNECNCLNEYDSIINDINIGNPDVFLNKIKLYESFYKKDNNGHESKEIVSNISSQSNISSSRLFSTPTASTNSSIITTSPSVSLSHQQPQLQHVNGYQKPFVIPNVNGYQQSFIVSNNQTYSTVPFIQTETMNNNNNINMSNGNYNVLQPNVYPTSYPNIPNCMS